MLIEPGDVIVADGNEVLRIPLADAPRVLSVAQARARREDEIRAAIAGRRQHVEVVGLQAALDASDMIEIDGTCQQTAAEVTLSPQQGRDLDDPIDAAYRAKYRRYAQSFTDAVTTAHARSTTTKLVLRPAGS